MFFSRCSNYIRLCDKTQSQPAILPGTRNLSLLFLFISSLFTSAEQGQKIAYSVTVQETWTTSPFLVPLPVEVGDWDGGPSLYGVQNPTEDKLSGGSPWAFFSASQGCAGCWEPGISALGLVCPWDRKDTALVGRILQHYRRLAVGAGKPSGGTQKCCTGILEKGSSKYHTGPESPVWIFGIILGLFKMY